MGFIYKLLLVFFKNCMSSACLLYEMQLIKTIWLCRKNNVSWICIRIKLSVTQVMFGIHATSIKPDALCTYTQSTKTKLTISCDIISPHSSWPGTTVKNPPAANTQPCSVWTQTSILEMSLWSLDRDRARILKAVYKQIHASITAWTIEDNYHSNIYNIIFHLVTLSILSNISTITYVADRNFTHISLYF